MRLLYNLLDRIKEGVTPGHEYYKMDSNEYNNFLKLLAKQGFIEVSNSIRRGFSIVEYRITDKGIGFLQENNHFRLEMPSDEMEIPHWIRFEGNVYVPRVKELRAASYSRKSRGIIDYSTWTKCMEFVSDASILKHGRSIVQIAGKATEEEISRIEMKLGITMPDSFKHVLMSYAKSVHFFWHVPESSACKLDYETRIQGGGFLDDGLWDLDKLMDYNVMREDSEHLDDDCKQHWANSLVFARDGMGSYYAIDLKYNVGEVIFLSNEGQYHGWRLGEDFETFFDNWISIGCAGSYVKDLIAFSTFESPYVSIESANARKFNDWISMKN
ncbi:SMI1/KNR4 family protein [Paenibacillus sp. strain BS8-2]